VDFEDFELVCDNTLPLIAPGLYDVVCLSARRTQKFRREVMAFIFEIASQGAHLGVQVPTYINFPRSKGRQVPPRSKLASWLRVIGAYDPTLNLKRVSLRIFGEYWFSARIVTVTHDYDGRALPAHDQYSKIDDLIAVIGKHAQHPKS
jgi:hypothetical protein